MATAVLLPSGRRHPRPQSILLQHPAYIQAPVHSPRTTMTMGGSRSPNRRIRFAPLPDPRRSVLITDDGNELPFPQDGFATQFPAPPTPSPTLDPRNDYFAALESASVSSSSSDSKRNSDLLEPSLSSSTSSTPGTATPVSITLTTPSEYDNASVPPSPVSTQCPSSPLTAVSNKLSEHTASSTPVSSSSKHRPFSSLFRFKRSSGSSSPSSSTTLTPVPSIDRSSTPTSFTFSRRNFSTEEILTLGTINLFRASSSREASDNEAGPSSGWSLSRWTSVSSSNSHHHNHPTKEPTWGHPLTRASSTQSYQSKSKASKDTKSSRPRAPVSRKGTRLLNGRYYGVKPRPNNANPFANARDDEPDFVEWGYGGMGSVKNAKSSGAHGHWQRLHTNSVSSTGGKEVDEDEDDGSGMAWIKKRREQREKEKKEREEKERSDREAVEKAESADTVPETPFPPAAPSTSLLSPQSALEVPGSATPRERTASRPGTANSTGTAQSASSSSFTATPANQAPTPKASTPTLNLPLPPPPTLIVTPSSSSTPVPSSSAVPTPCATTPLATTPGEDPEHVTRAVNIPAPAHHYHHRHSRAGSKDLTMHHDSSTACTPFSSVQVHQKTSSESGSDLDEEDDSEIETEEDEEDEEESSDEEQRREERKTALGAGVEKISRHH
ncbi:hypothetical protein D9756_001964 [Leucocoprinus leucothites]|uniref:Uncharacterized protein n=1 Tax=Leucocoprinus leucothites TaxID=201217 RepID=A0A8H5LIN2_9AGAR|nr:hypothetical protein D9756_001964 [Leucoagaricus leucothites]